MNQGFLKRFASVFLACLFLMGIASGCGNNTASPGTASSTGSASTPLQSSSKGFDTLNVGVLVRTVGLPAFYAQDKGWFEEAGLDVNLVIFPTGVPVNEAIAAKQIDIACSGFASIYSLASGGCSWIADINTTGGMGVYARPDSPVVQETGNVPDQPDILGSADTLRGAKILGALGTAQQFAAVNYIAKFGLTETDVEQVHMEDGPGFQAFVAGEGDLISNAPPYSYDCLDNGFVEVCSFEDATNVAMMDGCFARNDVIENRAEEVKIFLEVLVRAMDELESDEDLRFEFSLNKYHENAREFTDESMRMEIQDRKFVGKNYLSAPDYVFGEAMAPIAEFLTTQGKVVEDNLPNVEASLDPSLLGQATGLPINK